MYLCFNKKNLIKKNFEIKKLMFTFMTVVGFSFASSAQCGEHLKFVVRV
jgi:hypothetical protein